ncbi:MAG TPA: methyltransferase [Trebonia sp.]|nr:methyltransferase [Trebonia sp.]
MQAGVTAAQEAGLDAAYWRFHDAVARAQLTSWLAGRSRLLIDISGPASPAAALATSAGHKVLRVTDPKDAVAAGTQAAGPPAAGPRAAEPRAAGTGTALAPPAAGNAGPGRLRTVAADASSLQFLADGCADGLIAEDRTLSRRLAAEALVTEVCRVLRPGGRVLASVDSLTRGMSVLAEQNHWPHLIDLPHADVVLVPWPDGLITRCYGTEQLRELFTSTGFEVNWIRPRTVLSASTVGYLLARDPGSFKRLVEAELRTSADDSVGGQLVISATKKS